MCTSIMAGKKATCDGTLLLSRNEDYTRNNWNKYMIYRPYPEYYYPEGSTPPLQVKDGMWTLGNGLKVKVPEKRYRYNAMPDAVAQNEALFSVGNHFLYEERGINECNVAISATNSLKINEKANKADPLLQQGGVSESVIPTLLLPQVETAQEAVKLLGHYVEHNGASEVNGVLIGDPHEAWYVEIGSCHHWIAVKIPEDHYLAVANGMRVHSVDLENKENIMHSKGLFKFVHKHHLLENPDPRSFNFAQAFGIPGDEYNVDRIWLAQKILTPSLIQKPREFQYPLFLKPDQKIHVRDVMKVLRATYKGTQLEGIAKRPIGVDRTAESHIMVIDPKMPNDLKGLIWQAISTPMGAPYMPLYCVMDHIPQGFTMEQNQYSPLSAYWSFRELYSLCHSYGDEFIEHLHSLWEEFESQCFEEHKALSKYTLPEMYEKAPASAVNFAKRYSTGIAYQAVGLANMEKDRIMTRIATGNANK